MIKSTLLLAGSLFLALPAAAEVQGTYASDCQVIESVSTTLALDFAPEALTQVQRVFMDTKCQAAGYDLTISGPYILDESTGALDYTLDAISLTPLNAQVAAAFNIQKLCGLTGWSKGKAQTISGLTCGEQDMPAAGSVSYDVVKEVEGGIQTGKPSDVLDGSTAEKRPTEVDESLTYKLVE